MTPIFLTFEQVVAIHDYQIRAHGGVYGIGDENTVRSAVGMPSAGTVEGYFHAWPFGMAAAYCFYIAGSQGFIEGNKRTGLNAALTFLTMNGFMVELDNLEDRVMDLVLGNITRDDFARILEEGARPILIVSDQ